jgi:hypothetical protein
MPEGEKDRATQRAESTREIEDRGKLEYPKRMTRKRLKTTRYTQDRKIGDSPKWWSKVAVSGFIKQGNFSRSDSKPVQS